MKIRRSIRFAPVLLASMLIVTSFAGCAAKPADSQIEPRPIVTNESSTPEPTEEPIQYTASSEIENAALYSNALQIGNTFFSRPPQYKDIVKAGAVLATKDTTEDFLINSGETKTIELDIASTTIRLNMKNDSDKPCSLKDAEVGDTIYADGPEMFFPMGIRVGDSLSDLTEKWGQPSIDESNSNDKVLKYRYLEYPIALKKVLSSAWESDIISATGFSYNVTIDRNTSQIDSISYEGFDRSFEGSIVDVIKEKNFMNGDTWFLSYKVPYEFLQHTINQGGTAVTAYMVDDVPYVLVLNANLGSLGRSNSVVSEALLMETLNPNYASTIYEVDKIGVNGSGTVGKITGYSNTDQGYKCAGVYMDEKIQYTMRDSFLIPLDESNEVSEAALSKFKDIMDSFMNSISMSNTKEIEEPIAVEPIPTPEPTPETATLLGSWTLIGSYDPMKWGWKIDDTQPMPQEKIDPTDKPYTLIFNDKGLTYENSEETYKVKYDEEGTTATVDSEIYWVCIVVGNDQLFEYMGDTLSVYSRTKQ